MLKGKDKPEFICLILSHIIEIFAVETQQKLKYVFKYLIYTNAESLWLNRYTKKV